MNALVLHIVHTPNYLLGRNSIQTRHQEKWIPKTKEETIVFHSGYTLILLNLTHPLIIRLTGTKTLYVNTYTN